MGYTMKITVEDIEFRSETITLKGRTYRPTRRGKHPAVVICHGYPGDTKNMDLAEDLALSGVTTLIFYYKGAWGSGGRYSLLSLEPSTRDAVKFLRGLPYVKPDRVGLVSHSMGALPLTKVMSTDPTIRTGVLMSPAADFKELITQRGVEGYADRLLSNSQGKLTGVTRKGMMADIPKVAETMNPVDNIKLVKAPVAVIVGTKDDVTPPPLCRRLYEAANQPKTWQEIEGADHVYSEHRIPLIRAVRNHLAETL